MPEREIAQASTPVVGMPFWHATGTGRGMSAHGVQAACDAALRQQLLARHGATFGAADWPGAPAPAGCARAAAGP